MPCLFFAGTVFAGTRTMLSPQICISLPEFVSGFSGFSAEDFVDPAAPLGERIKTGRMVFARRQAREASAWPEFFLKYVLGRTTDELRGSMNEAIRWMNSETYAQMDNIRRLGYIEEMSRKLSPFERMLFYEGVYFTPEGSTDLGFGVHTQKYWGTLYFYEDKHFAHGAVHELKDRVELTFGDDLKRQNFSKLRHVHYYAYMRRLGNVYLRYPRKKLVIPFDQLMNKATYEDKNFLPQSLNFYLVKVGGFSPDAVPEEFWKQAVQEEYISQLKNGFHITHSDALNVIQIAGLSRDLSAEEKEYEQLALARHYKGRAISRERISSRDILRVEPGRLKKVWDEKYPLEIKDKVVTDNLGYCSGAVIAARGRLWFRRYGESPDILAALEKDLSAKDAAEIFNKDSRIVLMSTSYGAWRWYLDLVKERLIKQGVPEDNIEILNSETEPQLDGIGIYLFPEGNVVIHDKNHDAGVTETIEYSQGLENLHAPRVLSRFEVEDLAARKKEEAKILALNVQDSGPGEMSLPKKLLRVREDFSARGENREDIAAWPKFFLKEVLDPATKNLRRQMSRLIDWMESPQFRKLDDLSKLGYIESLSKDLTPFERILFYAGVYFNEPGKEDMGFGITTKKDWGTLYFYKKTLFAHSFVDKGKVLLELRFGDDLEKRNLKKIKYVHYYAYMKNLADVYAQNEGKMLVVFHAQLTALAMQTHRNFLARALNFYLLKVGGFMPEYEAPEGREREIQKQGLKDLRRGERLSFETAESIVDGSGLNRNLPLEERAYLRKAKRQNGRDKTPLYFQRISPRSFPNGMFEALVSQSI